MKVLFYNYQLNYRGTTTALVDYATYNQEILGNISVIGYNPHHPYVVNFYNESSVINHLSKKFEILGFDEPLFNHIVDQHKIDNFYSIRGGWPAPVPDNCRSSVHAVFNNMTPHGSRFAFISEWLSRINNYQCDFVPHIVHLPEPTRNMRTTWGIPSHARIIGRHGGLTEFDIPWVRDVVNRVVTYRNDYYFVFVNTEKWIDHPRILFLNPIFDLQAKSNFIATCDVMLHARGGGESFGLSIAEFLFHNKPVLAPNFGGDQNHLTMINDSNWLYNDAWDLEVKLNNFYLLPHNSYEKIQQYNPVAVMNKFHQVFLS